MPIGARFSAPVQTGPGAHPAYCTMGTGSFSGVKNGRGVTLTPHPLLVPCSRKGRAIPLLPLWAVPTACTEPQCLYKGALYQNCAIVIFTVIHILSSCICLLLSYCQLCIILVTERIIKLHCSRYYTFVSIHSCSK